MAQATPLSKIPLLRILIPFAVGIAFAEIQHNTVISILLIIIGIGAYLTMNVAWRHGIKQKEKLRHHAIVPIALMLVGLGNFHALISAPPTLDVAAIEGKTAIARVDELKFTDFSSNITATLLQVDDSTTQNVKVHISTRGCDYTLGVGDLIAFEAHLLRIKNQGNPYETDYARLQYNKGILYTQHLKLDQIEKIGHKDSFRNKITRLRGNLEQRIINSRLDADTQSFMIALLLGDAAFIDRDTRYAYSCAGIAHILALSGLHVGIVTLLIWFLLYPLDYLRLKKLRLGVTLLMLIAFAMLTGLSASVIRATVMTAFVFIGYVLFTKSSPLSALAAAALVILVITPSALFNVGFQLSFITVAAIIIFFPQKRNNSNKKNPVLSYVSSTVIVSLIAMLSTLMLSAYYFHTISLASVFSNMLVLPVLTVVMACGAVFFLLSLAGIDLFIIDWTINGLFHIINCIVDSINSLGISYIDNVYVSLTDVLVYYIMISLLGMAWKMRSKKLAIAGGSVLAIGILLQAYQVLRLPQQGVTLLNDFSNTPIFFFENRQGYLWVPDADTVDLVKFKRRYAGMLAHQRIDSVRVVNDDGIELPWAYVKPPFAMIGNQRIAAIGNKHSPAYASDSLPKVDLAIVTKRCHATVGQLHERYPTATLILSGGIYRPDHDILVHECESAHTSYYSVVNSGAWVQQW